MSLLFTYLLYVCAKLGIETFDFETWVWTLEQAGSVDDVTLFRICEDTSPKSFVWVNGTVCISILSCHQRQPVANISKHSLVWPCPDVLSHFKVAVQWRWGNVLAWMRSARCRHEAVSQLSQPNLPNLSLFSFGRHGLSSPISSPSHGWF